MKPILVAATILMSSINSANAGFRSWSYEIKQNPFSGGIDVAVLYSLTERTQVQVSCDSGKSGIKIVAIPGYEMTERMRSLRPKTRIAVDGEIILSEMEGNVRSFGANKAGIIIELTKKDAVALTNAFIAAQRQIAIEDGMSARPFLLSAKGSTAAAKKIKQCYDAQKGNGTDISVDGAPSNAERIAEIKAEIEKLNKELGELENE